LNWQIVKNLTHVQIGTFLALLIVAVMPNFGLKYAAGPALPAALLALVGGWLVWKQRVVVFAARSTRRLTIVFSLLLVPVLISIPTSYDVRYSSTVAVVLVAYYFTGLALLRVLHGDAEREWLAKWILFVLAFWVVDSLVQYIFRVDLFGIPISAIHLRVVGPFENSLRQPMLIAFLLPVALWFLMRKGMIPTLAFFAVAGFVAMLGGVRMVFVMLVIVAVGLYLKLPRWRWKFSALLLAFALLLTAMGLSPQMQSHIKRMSEIRDLNFESINLPLGYRPVIWETASHMLLARPLTGVGAGAFAKAYDDFSTRESDVFRGGRIENVHHAHQVYFSMAAETGWPGLIGFIVAIVLCVKWYRVVSPDRRDQAWPYALGLMAYFFPVNTQPPLYHGNWVFPIILLMFATLLAALDGEPSTKDTTVPEQV
jgi:O-antigen ligase